VNALNAQLIDCALTTYAVNQHRVLPKSLNSNLDIFLGPETYFQIVSSPGKSVSHWSDLTFIEYKSSLNKQSPVSIWNDKLYPRHVAVSVLNLNTLKLVCQKSHLAAYLPEWLTRKEQEKGTLEVVATAPTSVSVQPCFICSQERSKKIDKTIFQTLGFSMVGSKC